MDIRLSDEQVEMARQARRFLEKECPPSLVRAMMDDHRGFTDPLWEKMGDMGWLGMHLPEPYGGLGLGLMDLAVVLEEMGRAVLPGPFFSSVILAAEIIRECGTNSQKEAYLSGIAKGHLRGTLALYEPEGGADPGYINLKANANDDEFILEGIKLFVPDAHVSHFLICAARTQDSQVPFQGITLFLVPQDSPDLAIRLSPTMDATRKLCAVEFKGVRVGPENTLGRVHQGGDALQKVLQAAQVGLCAESIGLAQRAMEMAVDYAKIRIQFDQPIGAFQAVKHRCARMFEEMESARSLLYWAAWAQDFADPVEAALAASTVKGYCSEMGKNVVSSTIQVLGGTGFSWEHDIHLYLKRAKANEVSLGDPVYHREQIVRSLER
jgi:alkylation response protein AidB-like acyl-CoA dehydrogenase